HYLKVMASDKIHKEEMEVGDCQRWLNNWISDYVLPGPPGESGEAPLASYYRQVLARAKNGAPLAEAPGEGRGVQGKSARDQVVVWLRPSFQLEGSTAVTRVVAEVPLPAFAAARVRRLKGRNS